MVERVDHSSTVNKNCTTSSAVDTHSSSAREGRKFKLPSIRPKLELIGRESEMEELTRYLHDEAVEVVTLYSGPGYGKTTICQHIGHTEIKAGTDVYYISVSVLPNVERLVEKLISISQLKLNLHDVQLKSWAKAISNKTLLILDDVDGPSWSQDTEITSFWKDFTGVLLQYSHDFHKKLKILVTSELEIKPQDCEFRSLNLSIPSLPTCVTIFSMFANKTSRIMFYVSDSPCTTENPGCLERDKVESVCNRVGKVPKVLTTLASHLSKTITIDHLIKRLDENALKYADDSTDPGDVTHLMAYGVAFDIIQPKYLQICCLLFTRFSGFFTVAMTESIITRDLMVNYSKNFHVIKCIKDLSRDGFIETTKYSSLAGVGVMDHHIHNHIRDFLTTTDKVSVPREVLEDFWDAYFEQAEDSKGDSWLREDLSDEDTNIILDFLSRRVHNSYRLARHVTSYISVNMGGAVAHLRNEAVNMLLADCKDLSLIYPPSSVPLILESYANVFFMPLAGNYQNYMDLLAMCWAKVKQLNSMVGYSYGLSTVNYFDRSYFQSLISSKCKCIQNSHELCGNGWRNNMSKFVDILLREIKHMEDWHCDYHTTYPNCLQYLAPCYTNNGLTMYNGYKYDEAEKELSLALKDNSSSNCREIHDVIVYIVLYDIYFNKNDQQKAEETLANIAQINFEEANLTCYQTLLKDIVIPFLDWINSTDLAKQIDILKGFPYNPFLEELENLMLSEERADQIFAGEESLFCLVSMDLLEGCLP